MYINPMPYAKKYSKRSKSYRSRLNDKKINTAIERKIRDIAIREDKKSYRRDSRITQDAGAYLSDGSFDPNNSGLGLRTIPVVYNIAWSAADAIPTQETQAIQYPNTTVSRLQTNPGIRQTDEIFIDKIDIRGCFRTKSNGSQNMVSSFICRLVVASVEVPVLNKPGNTGYTEIEYDKLINPAICMPGYMNGMFWQPDFYRAVSGQKIHAVKTFKCSPPGGAHFGGVTKKLFNLTVKFKKPFRQRYDIKDPNGILPVDRILYYAIVVDQEATSTSPTPGEFRPHVTMNHKVYYYEKS